MTKSISNLTYKIVAFTEVEQVDCNESIDWAIEMMELGHESPTLFMLAGFSKPTNYFEVINYVTNTVQELGLEMKNGKDAILSYASFYVRPMSIGLRVRENLTELYQFYLRRDFDNLIYDFYMLYHAWDYLGYEDTEYNPYWDGATRENIEQIVIDFSKKWMTKNEDHFAQSHPNQPQV